MSEKLKDILEEMRNMERHTVGGIVPVNPRSLADRLEEAHEFELAVEKAKAAGEGYSAGKQSVTDYNQHETVDLESCCIYGDVTKNSETVADVIDAFEYDMNNELVLNICNKPYFRKIVARLRRAHGKEVEQYAKANRYEVCNAAKMREALRKCANYLDVGDAGLCKGECDALREVMQETLSAPPRNCDLYLTPKDAMLAHLDDVYEGEKVEFGDYEWCEFVKWLFAEAKGE